MLLRSLSRSQKQDYEPQVNPALTQYPGLSRLYLLHRILTICVFVWQVLVNSQGVCKKNTYLIENNICHIKN